MLIVIFSMMPKNHQRYDEHTFWEEGLLIMNHGESRASDKTLCREFLSFFGADPVHVHIIWILLLKNGWLQLGGQLKPYHLLWTFYFLKVYSSFTVLAKNIGCDVKTFRERVWFFTEGIATLDNKVVS